MVDLAKYQDIRIGTIVTTRSDGALSHSRRTTEFISKMNPDSIIISIDNQIHPSGGHYITHVTRGRLREQAIERILREENS